MISKTYTATLSGITGHLTTVEADLSRGLPSFHIVGLTDTIIKESIERIRVGLVNSGYDFPQCRITVNLSPADKRKYGSHYDLAIAVALVRASRQCEDFEEKQFAFFGELALDGKVNGVPGILPLILTAEEKGIENIVVPFDNMEEACMLKRSRVFAVKSLVEAVEVAEGKAVVLSSKGDKGQNSSNAFAEETYDEDREEIPDFIQVFGQENAKRAMVIAAAGGHNLFMMGIPGVGKTMMAERFKYILPEMTYEELVEVTKIYSVSGLTNNQKGISTKRPFRKPYSNVTQSAMFGGGVVPKPGEISLAHKGVLFLDEFSNFDSKIVEGLRKPMDDGSVNIVRKRESVEYPCEFLLLMASNPCKCGYAGSENHMCTCTAVQLNHFRERLVTPLMDRVDLFVQMNNVKVEEIDKKYKGMSTKEMKAEVEIARKMQRNRFKRSKIKLNSQMDSAHFKKYCALGEEEKSLLDTAYKNMNLSMRGYRKVMKVSRTIADLEGSKDIKVEHIAEALQYREMRELINDASWNV